MLPKEDGTQLQMRQVSVPNPGNARIGCQLPEPTVILVWFLS